MKIEQSSQIVEAAFDEWGKTHFANTSLSLVASRLAVTKQAIYRHFPNKNALIGAMIEQLRADYAKVTDRFLSRLSQVAPATSLEGVLRNYVESYMDFLRTNPNYYIFLAMYYVHSHVLDDDAVFGEAARQRKALGAALSPLFPGTDEGSWDLLLHHVMLTTSLATALFFWTVEGKRRSRPEQCGAECERERGRERHIERVVEVLKSGLVSGARSDLDFGAVELAFTVRPEELEAPNRIVKALERTVALHGIENASLDRIAQEAGISKSTIYFYFANKDDMLHQMILHEQSQFVHLWQKRAATMQGTGERVYGYMVMLSSYFMQNTALLSMFEWLRYRRIQPHLPEEGRERLEEPLAFLRAEVANGTTGGAGMNFSELAALLWAIVLWRVFTLRPRFDPEETKRSMRMSYRLFTLGLEQLIPHRSEQG